MTMTRRIRIREAVEHTDRALADATAASTRIQSQAPVIERVHQFLMDRKRENSFGLEYEVSLVRRV